MTKALIVVDYQNDFVTGSLGFEKAKEIENNICKKISTCRHDNYDIIFTLDTHYDNYLETSEGKFLPVKHCIKDTYGWELYGKVKDNCLSTDTIFIKNDFGSIDLANYFKEKQFHEVILVGLITDICVLVNAILARTYLPHAKIVVDASCTCTIDNNKYNNTLDIMKGLNIEIINR